MLGRPSKYDRKFIKSVTDYLSNCEDEYYKELKKTDSEGKETTEQIPDLTVSLPTIEGFARYIGVNKTTLYEWTAKHTKSPYDFSNALEEIKTEQHKRLINMGLSGKYNSTIAKLILSSNHGMSDRTDHTTGGKEIQPILVKFLGDDKTADNNDSE